MAASCLARCVSSGSSISIVPSIFSSGCTAPRIGLRMLQPALVQVTPMAFLQNFGTPPTYKDVEFPPEDLTRDGRLKTVMKVPYPPANMKPLKMPRGRELMRGPEEIHNSFIHKQFGIVALQGGRLKYGHFEMIRQTINRKIDPDRMFAVWRVDPPWYSVTKKSVGTRMGGGKGAINHYVAPIKAGRVIIEVGGNCSFQEVQRVMEDVALKLPVIAKATTYQDMEAEKEEALRQEKLNLNPFTMEYVIKNNMQGVSRWLSPYDYLWYCKYR
ncbi:putative 39S ribosomal protein L16, mitochondrial [Hypsibius exemplaris]|uniref:Large ribosomal subunit protein uL16m n=1 Tax=Hypsibius exemplaris TaxID=2072580 RepID=A0A1W0WKX4_HYPEX|nr:putative 39S ribosomal protein L16, mitochondrial [Hypsibius exemplaris]